MFNTYVILQSIPGELSTLGCCYLDKKSVTSGMKFIFRGFCFLPKMDLDTVFCMKKVN